MHKLLFVLSLVLTNAVLVQLAKLKTSQKGVQTVGDDYEFDGKDDYSQIGDMVGNGKDCYMGVGAGDQSQQNRHCHHVHHQVGNQQNGHHYQNENCPNNQRHYNVGAGKMIGGKGDIVYSHYQKDGPIVAITDGKGAVGNNAPGQYQQNAYIGNPVIGKGDIGNIHGQYQQNAFIGRPFTGKGAVGNTAGPFDIFNNQFPKL